MSDLDSSFEKLLLDSDAEDGDNDVSDGDAAVYAVTTSSSGTSNSTGSQSADSWTSIVDPNSRWNFTGQSGPSNAVFQCSTPLDYYQLFVNNALIDLVVRETNRQGCLKYRDYRPIDSKELRKFTGLCLQMGIVKLPALRDYWSSRPALGGSPIAGSLMPRKRFEEILGALHFADNSVNSTDRLYKIREFLEMFNKNCEAAYKPGQAIAIDESLVPFRGRIVFRQYIPSKKHKYGIKLFKLCTKGGYTWRIKVYTGKNTVAAGPVAESIVMNLMEDLFDCGRKLVADNWYTSIGLAERLIQRRTHLIGTLRKNRKRIPLVVKEKKLKRGEIICRHNSKGITILKWKDKRDLYMISTLHDASRNGDEGKPFVVEDYNRFMGYVDQSDQMAAYSPFVRKTTRWYLRIFFHVVCQTAVVNAWVLYNECKEKIRINEFKMRLIEQLLVEPEDEDDDDDDDHALRSKKSFSLDELIGPKSVTRRRCSGCYEEQRKEYGRTYAFSHTKKVNTVCNHCFKHYCLSCYRRHQSKCSEVI